MKDYVIESVEDAVRGFISKSFDIENNYDHSYDDFRSGPPKPKLIGRTIKIECVVDPEYKKEPEWKILDVNDLPYRWFDEGKYEYELKFNFESIWRTSEKNSGLDIVKEIARGIPAIYRYRLTPTKKTDDELTEEYLHDDMYVCNDKTTIDNNELRKVQVKAFIAGRKSMEGKNERNK